MDRRNAIPASLLLGGLPLCAWAQQKERVWRIGVLSQSVPREGFWILPLRLAGLGYVEGRNLVVDFRFAQGQAGLLPRLAAELVASKPDLLIGLLNSECLALRQATTTIPIVMMYVTAPEETGLVVSLARPGGNITGTTTNTPELAGRMTQLLRDAVAGLSRITWLNEPEYPGMALYMRQSTLAGDAMGLRVAYLAVRTLSDLEPVLAELARDRPDAVGIATTGVLLQHYPRVIAFMAEQKLPALYSIRAPVVDGGLMSYAADFAAMAGRNAWMIDRIFKGAKPADVPVEEPATFQLSINMKTARALGLVIPRSVLAQATELIE